MRLFEIIYLLMEKKNVTASVLAERFEVSTRTIHRDIDLLSSAGIPVYTSRGKGGGIRLTDGFVLNKSLLSENEQNEILSALAALEVTQYPAKSEIVKKMGALFQKSAARWIEVDFTDWSHTGREMFEELRSAILERRVVAFDYYSSYGEKTSRVVEPFLLWFKHKSWYIRAYDRDKQDERVFKLTRVKSIKALNEHFEPRSQPETPVPDDRSSPVANILMRVDASQLYRIYDEFDESMIEKSSDGAYFCRAAFPEDEWVYGYILSFGHYAEVLEPPHIREIIKERLEKALSFYGK